MMGLNNLACDECGKRDHPKLKCWLLLKNDNPAETSAEQKWCTYHRMISHNTDECFTLEKQANATKTSPMIIQHLMPSEETYTSYNP